MKKVLFSRKAAQEFLGAKDYYNNESHGLGVELSEETQQALSRYPVTPKSVYHSNKKMRRFVLARFPYYIIYRPLPDGYIRILAIAHQKRKPWY